ncbi:MAG: type toxin-antitoxin system Phd/YefM family antitoxin [Gemmatimonadetes bacterium]|nr:type toxin-antitoxin system Phd/YefM family antitoxin [Gemmatimonadota bacterium]
MDRIRLDEDVKPVSEFRQNAARFVQQVRDTHRPLVLTQHGKSAAVLLDVREYERLLDSVELMEGIREAERELDAGLGVPHERVMADLLERFDGR